jgi:uncharacterized damage-inducible protein DinB
MKDFFRELFEYNQHCNQLVADVITDHTGRISEKAMTLFCHSINAHQIWNNRIDPQSATFGVWQLHSPEACKMLLKENFEHSLSIIEHFDLATACSYSNTKGQSFSNTVGDILFHMINHTTYHRGQIATELRSRGIEPVVADFIFYKRRG